MEVEVLISDIEDRMHHYDALEKVVAQYQPNKVFLAGDIRHHINYERVEELKQEWMSNPTYNELKDKIDVLSNEIQEYISTNYEGNAELLSAKLNSDQASDEDKAIYAKDKQCSEYAKMLETQPFGLEAKEGYGLHNDALEKIKSICSDIYAVHGNHDTGFASRFMTNAVFGHRESQPLLEEKVLMAYNVGYGPEVNEQFNGPNKMFQLPQDDHPSDLEKSFIYQNFKDRDLDLIVTHNSGTHMIGEQGFNDRYTNGIGLKTLTEEKACIVYAGHIRSKGIWRTDSDAVIIRPGEKHIAVVWREGNRIKGIKFIPIEDVT